jgi:predicted ATP-grasp superfamily ATP-dependent carboligase
MNVLVTSSRFPHALCEIRRFGERGHDVYAADTFREAPGSHSKYVVESFVTPSPTFTTEAYISDLEEIVASRRIDLLVPSFEEALYIAEHKTRFDRLTQAFCSPFGVLTTLHDKSSFVELSREIGVRVPKTVLVQSDDELRYALRSFREYIARPAYSRGGTSLLTNTGPLAFRMELASCKPTALEPWIVQEFVHGIDVCSFSIAHQGHIAAHCTYEHPKTIEHAGGILFESVNEPESLHITARYAEALGYDGQISFDYIRTNEGLVAIECNPRPTAGVFMMSSDVFCDAIARTKRGPANVVPAGVRRQIKIAIMRDMWRNWRQIPRDIRILCSGVADVYAERGDTIPALYSLLSYTHVNAFRRHMKVNQACPTDLVAAQFFDVLWNGSCSSRSPDIHVAVAR